MLAAFVNTVKHNTINHHMFNEHVHNEDIPYNNAGHLILSITELTSTAKSPTLNRVKINKRGSETAPPETMSLCDQHCNHQRDTQNTQCDLCRS